MIGLFFIMLLVLEVGVLSYMEYISWRTIYTPLCCLMLPYALVQCITLLIAGHFGFVEFYYPSIFVWSIGLVLFALPSYVFSLATSRYPNTFSQRVEERRYPVSLAIISLILIVAFAFKLANTFRTSAYLFGTDEFAEDFSGHGLWAHLRGAIVPLLIIAIYYVHKRSFVLWAIIFSFLFIQLIYMVKGTIIISVLAGLLIRLYAGKGHLSLGLMIKVLLGAVALFVTIYMVIPLIGNNGEANLQLMEFVLGHFVHYLTSGTLGYSYDLKLNCPDARGIETLVLPFINIYRQLTGNDEMLSAVNPCYLFTGISWTNVRTFFGTMYIYCNTWQFVVYTLTVSTLMYGVKLIAISSQNLYIHAILFYHCALLAMGWFEFYLFHLDAIEVPLICLVLMCIANLEEKKN